MHRNDTHYPILMKFAALTGECQTETRQQVASLVLRSGSDDWVIDQINPVMLQDHKVQDQGQDQDQDHSTNSNVLAPDSQRNYFLQHNIL